MKSIYRMSFVLLIVFGGCATSKISTLWKAENIDPHNYNRVLVLALIQEKDRSIQENMENHLVGDLMDLGYDARSALQEYGPKAFEKMNEDSAVAKLKAGGTDAVITIVLLDKEKERRYVPVNLYYSPFGYYYYQFGPYRMALYRRINEPGYYVTDTRYFWESNLYDMKTQKLEYSVQTQSFDHSNTAVMAHEFGQLIVKNMLANNVLEKKDNTPKRGFE